MTRSLLSGAVFAAAYVVASLIARLLSAEPSHFATFWVPSGLYLAVLLRSERRDWPFLFAGGVAANVGLECALGRQPWVALMFAFANSTEAFVAGAWLGRAMSSRTGAWSTSELARIPFVIRFVVIAGLCSTSLGALIGSLTVTVAYGGPWLPTFVTWAVSDAVGILIVTPLLLVTREEWATAWGRLRRVHPLELALAVFVSIGLGWFIFWMPPSAAGSSYLIAPVVLWFCLRFRTPGAVCSMLVLSVAAVLGANAGHGAFAGRDLFTISVTDLQGFLSVASASALAMAAAITQADETSSHLDALNRSLADEVARQTQSLTSAVTQLRLAVDAAEIGTWQWVQGSPTVDADARMRSLIDLDPDEPLTTRVLHGRFEDDPQKVRAQFVEWLKVGGLLDYEHQLIDRHGRRRWIAGRAALVRGSNGVTIATGVSYDVTRQKEAESLRLQTERRIRQFADSAPATLWATDAAGEMTFRSRDWFALTGQSPSGGIGSAWLDAVHADDRQRVRGALITAHAGGQIYAAEYRVRLADGSLGWVLDSGRPFLTESGEFEGFVGSVVDISQLKRLAEEREQAIGLVDAIFDGAPVGLGYWDRDLKFRRVNEHLAAMTGIPAADHIGKQPAELLPSMPGLGQIVENWQRMIDATVPPIRVDVVGETPAAPGVTRYWRESFFPVAVSGVVTGLGAVVEDVTDQRRAEIALRDSDERFRQLADHLDAGLWILDLPGQHIRYASSGFRRVWNVDPSRLVDRRHDWVALIHVDDREQVERAFEAFVDVGGEFHVEYRITLPGGATRWVQDRAFVVKRDETDAVRVVAGLSIDTTARREAEQALREADRQKDAFLAMLAHELRNPLAPIRTATQILGFPGVDERAARQSREIIDRQVTHIVRLVDDLLDVSRLSRGRLILQKARVDLASVVRDTTEDYRRFVEDARLSLQVDLPAAPVWVDGDPTRLGQVLGNLLHNARKFSTPGGRVVVRLEPADAPGWTRMIVSDTGVGIAASLLPRVFEAFSQGPQSIDRAAGGLGLGLSLVKGLTDLHGGQVEASSDGQGHGATFVVTLPTLPVAVQETARPDAQVVSERGGLRVAVVEDNVDAAEMLRTLLELDGHLVDVSHTGPDGVAHVESFAPDVVLCDIGLPGAMSGLDVARAVRASHPVHPFLVALTGYADDGHKRESARAGFDRHLTKPVGPEELDEVFGVVRERLRAQSTEGLRQLTEVPIE